ncbi:MAG: alkaline phosphatase D family protein [Pseudomonadota bacterium]|nr:alkaline phosphatase D family protein [Pseudomonadota bacterium]
MPTIDRRTFLGLLAAAAATPYLVSFTSGRAGAALIGPDTPLQRDWQRVFGLSVASGDPSPTGVVLWTRINPSAWAPGQQLMVQVARDPDFLALELETVLTAEHIRAERDYCVAVDVEGYLQPDYRYYYRFIYRNTVSRTGRCRTAPAYGARLEHLKLALLTCQDYTNGYYGGLTQIAHDDSIDFVLHLGDFIYETAGDPTFQSLPFEDRLIRLPSGGLVALDLEDYRHLYRVYRSDPALQRAMEQHTFIITRDDHETANDAFWDYERDTLGAPDHPYTLDPAYGNDPALLNQLMLDSQQAWLEYVPARVKVDWSSSDPHRFLQYYRQVQLGDLVDLFMLDGRTYRSAHPCGEGEFFQRYIPYGCDTWRSDQQTLLGAEQRDWLINGLVGSTARWKLLGNQTYMGSLGIQLSNGKLPINVDAWDGFDFERNLINHEIAFNQVENFVVVTGDLHTYIASHIKQDYSKRSIFDFRNFIGVEFMTPALTSAGLFDIIGAKVPAGEQQLVAQALTNTAVRLTNPHIRYFNTVQNGYSTIEFNDRHCDWKAYIVDKNINSDDQPVRLIRHYRKYTHFPWLITQAALIY